MDTNTIHTLPHKRPVFVNMPNLQKTNYGGLTRVNLYVFCAQPIQPDRPGITSILNTHKGTKKQINTQIKVISLQILFKKSGISGGPDCFSYSNCSTLEINGTPRAYSIIESGFGFT